MIKVGLIGAGKIAETFHLPAWRQVADASVTAICDPREDAARALGARFGIEKVYPSAAAMIAGAALDAVDICSPHRLHVDHALVALEKGLHCVIEKPMATTAEEAAAIAGAAARAGRVVMCAQHQRFRPPSLLLKQLIDAGDLGDIYCVRVDAMNARGVPGQIANSFTDFDKSRGGPLIDQGAHGLDVAWWFMGCPKPVSAFAVTADRTAPKRGRTPGGGEWDVYSVEDFAAGMLRFDNGGVITIHTSYIANCARDHFACEVLGTKAGATWPDILLTRPDGDDVSRQNVEPESQALASVAELTHFIALVNGRDAPMVPLEQSVTLIAMIDALYRSANSGDLITF
jgi:predicted dehydrogenase